jgi:hypothetical protein
LAKELLGLNGFSSVGQGGACVNMAQELLSASMDQGRSLTRQSIQLASMLTALGPHPHVTKQSYFQFSVVGSLP